MTYLSTNFKTDSGQSGDLLERLPLLDQLMVLPFTSKCIPCNYKEIFCFKI